MFIVVVYNGDRAAEFGKPFARRCDRVSILIDADQPAAGCKSLQNVIGVTAAAQCSVYIYSVRPDRQIIQHLLKEH